MMKQEYERIQITVTEFDVEDIITTSGEVTRQGVKMNSPSYDGGASNGQPSGGWNWTLWQ